MFLSGMSAHNVPVFHINAANQNRGYSFWLVKVRDLFGPATPRHSPPSGCDAHGANVNRKKSGEK